MKNLKKILILTFIFSFMSKLTIFADMKLDKANTADGILGVRYTGTSKNTIKLTVEKDNIRYVYNIKNSSTNYVPLQMGTGTYKISLNQQLSGTKYKVVSAENVSVSKINGNNMYTYSTIITYFTSAMSSIKDYANAISGKSKDDKVYSLYKDVVYNYTYDHNKVSDLPADYVPYIEDMYSSKKGICYDYSAMMAGVLRNEGIPTKLVMGYAPDVKVYHAWNEIYMNGKWVVVDTTSDATRVQAGHKVNFSKDASKFQVLKVY